MTVSFHYTSPTKHKVTLLLEYFPVHSRNLRSRISLRRWTMASSQMTMATFRTVILKKIGILRVLLGRIPGPNLRNLANWRTPLANTENMPGEEELSRSRTWPSSRVFAQNLSSFPLNWWQFSSFFALPLHRFDRVRDIWIRRESPVEEYRDCLDTRRRNTQIVTEINLQIGRQGSCDPASSSIPIFDHFAQYDVPGLKKAALQNVQSNLQNCDIVREAFSVFASRWA